METINTNGFSTDDAVLQKSNNALKTNEYKPSFVQYQPTTNPISMAPRTAIAELLSLPLTSLEGDAMKPEYDVHSDDYISLTPTKSAEPLSMESVNQQLHRLSTRHRIIMKKASLLLSRLDRLAQNNHTKPFVFDGNTSEKTESSSDEQEDLQPQHQSNTKTLQLQPRLKASDTWYQTRAIIRSHWSLLETEIVQATDCLDRLKPLRNRCKRIRKSFNPLVQCGGLIESSSLDQVSSRTMIYEKTDKPRHSYFDVRTMNQIDFKFSGSAAPLQVSHPHCQQACASGCILCCPAFNPKTSRLSVRPKKDPFDISSRSTALDQAIHSLSNREEKVPQMRTGQQHLPLHHLNSHDAFSASTLMLRRKRPPAPPPLPNSHHPSPPRRYRGNVSSASCTQDTPDFRRQRPRYHLQQVSRQNSVGIRYGKGGRNDLKSYSYFSPSVTGLLYPGAAPSVSRKEPKT